MNNSYIAESHNEHILDSEDERKNHIMNPTMSYQNGGILGPP